MPALAQKLPLARDPFARQFGKMHGDVLDPGSPWMKTACAVVRSLGSGSMTYYRLYFLAGTTGPIQHFREFELTDDLAAIRQAAKWRGPEPMELWAGARKVRVWGAADLNASDPAPNL